MNLVILADTRLGDGIEAWLTLDEQDMARLECNPELLTFASLDPSPLMVGHSIANLWRQVVSTYHQKPFDKMVLFNSPTKENPGSNTPIYNKENKKRRTSLYHFINVSTCMQQSIS